MQQKEDLVRHDMAALLDGVRRLHGEHDALHAFAPFPDDVKEKTLTPFHVPAADLMLAETGFGNSQYNYLCDALFAVAPQMLWRETYKGTKISSDFMERFGCFEIIGRDAPFASKSIRSFLVYQPANLHYPWHQHPAEEMYVVLNGEAEFALSGQPNRTLSAGESAFHASNKPHALTTHDKPVLAYVIWRDEFDTAPEWTYPDDLEK